MEGELATALSNAFAGNTPLVLFGAIAANFLMGVLAAMLKGNFSWEHVPDILRKALYSIAGFGATAGLAEVSTGGATTDILQWLAAAMAALIHVVPLARDAAVVAEMTHMPVAPAVLTVVGNLAKAKPSVGDVVSYRGILHQVIAIKDGELELRSVSGVTVSTIAPYVTRVETVGKLFP